MLKFVNAILQNPLDEGVYHKPLSKCHPASAEGTVSDLHNSLLDSHLILTPRLLILYVGLST